MGADVTRRLVTLLLMIASVSADCSFSDDVRSIPGIVLQEDKEVYLLWESVLFSCEEGYAPLLDGFKSFCTDEDIFDPEPTIFSCLKTCEAPEVQEDTTFSSDGSSEPAQTYEAYQVIEFSCAADVTVGYLEDDVQPVAYCNNGVWEPSVFADCKVSCEIPTLQNDTLYNSTVVQEDDGYIKHGTAITYECTTGIPGGTIEGPSNATCDDGQFDDESTPDCKVSCESPPGLEPFGVVDHGESANFTCASGGIILDGNDVTCNDGEWSKDPQCSFRCPGRDEYYIPLDLGQSSRKKRSTALQGDTPSMLFDDDRLVGVTAGLVAMVTTTSAVGFVSAVIKAGDVFSEVF